MNPRRVMWCSQERAQCRCVRIISVEISCTKRHEQRKHVRRCVSKLPTIDGDRLRRVHLHPSFPSIPSCAQLSRMHVWCTALPNPLRNRIMLMLIVLITLKSWERASMTASQQAPTPLQPLFVFVDVFFETPRPRAITEHCICKCPATAAVTRTLLTLGSLSGPFAIGGESQDY